MIVDWTREQVKEALGYTEEEYLHMLQVQANSRILMDDYFDDLRTKAIVAACDGLPGAVVEYIHELEEEYLNHKIAQHRRALRDVPFTTKK